MSPQGVAALYGVVTFAILAGAYMALVHFVFGWPPIPQTDRMQGSIMLLWYVIAGIYARNVGRAAAEGATLGQAWREGLYAFGRGVKKQIER